MSRKKRKRRFPDDFIDWMSGYCSAFDSLPDGAWQAACESAVVSYNEDHGTNIDPFDGWMYWMTKTEVRNERHAEN